MLSDNPPDYSKLSHDYYRRGRFADQNELPDYSPLVLSDNCRDHNKPSHDCCRQVRIQGSSELPHYNPQLLFDTRQFVNRLIPDYYRHLPVHGNPKNLLLLATLYNQRWIWDNLSCHNRLILGYSMLGGIRDLV